MSACTHACMDGWTDGRRDGRTDGWTDGWMDGWMDEDGWMVDSYTVSEATHIYMLLLLLQIQIACMLA